MNKYINRYFCEASAVLDAINRDILGAMVRELIQLRSSSGRLFILGVGGSAANASHAVNDFRKISGIEAYTPTDNVSELTARINDDDWESTFVEWLKGSRINREDMVLILSVGGGSEHTSKNIVKAIDYSKNQGATILGIVSRDGGHTARTADLAIVLAPQSPDTITPLAESFQALIWHLLATAIAKEASTI